MGNFLAIIAPNETDSAANAEQFRRAVDCARQIKSQTPSQVIETDFVRAAAFARRNGSGGLVATDAATGDWLIANGTWFHTRGYASGEEARLLARIGEVGARRVADELEGFFVIVYARAQTREVFVITDVMGSRHCFISELAGAGLAISTSSLLLAKLSEATPDPVACEEFLRVGIVYEDRTLFSQVRKLEPATVYRFAQGKLAEARRYWRFGDLDPQAFDGRRAVREVGERLVNAATRIGKIFARPVCDLTGGYDSRSVVAAFMTAGVNFETTVSGPADSADVIVSQELAKITGVPHWHLEPEVQLDLDALEDALSLTDGECELLEYSRISSLHRALSERFDANINGSYGEVVRGYCWWELLFPRTGRREQIDLLELAERRYATDECSEELFAPAQQTAFVNHLAAIIGRYNQNLAGALNTAQMDNAYLMLRMQRWQGRIASSTDQIWPCISPFIFRSVLDATLQTSVSSRKYSRLIRNLLVELQPQLAAQPMENGYPPMPVNLTTWPRFIPATGRYAEKAWKKAQGKLLNGKLPTGGPEPARLLLWRDQEVLEILNPAKMRLSEVIGEERLRSFLASSQQPLFRYDQQWRRVLTVEMALRAARGYRFQEKSFYQS